MSLMDIVGGILARNAQADAAEKERLAMQPYRDAQAQALLAGIDKDRFDMAKNQLAMQQTMQDRQNVDMFNRALANEMQRIPGAFPSVESEINRAMGLPQSEQDRILSAISNHPALSQMAGDYTTPRTQFDVANERNMVMPDIAAQTGVALNPQFDNLLKTYLDQAKGMKPEQVLNIAPIPGIPGAFGYNSKGGPQIFVSPEVAAQREEQKQQFQSEQLDKRLAADTDKLIKQITAADRRAERQIAAADRRAERTMGAKGAKEAQKDESNAATINETIATIDKLLSHPGRVAGTGASSMLDPRNYMPGTAASDFRKELESFDSKLFLANVAKMKGMGALSDKEGAKISAAAGAIKPSMSEKAFIQNMNTIREGLEAAKGRLEGGQTRSVMPRNSAPAPSGPKIGAIEGGYRFKGGNPADPKSWVKVK